ncbi:hypothetical protein L7F22_054962 [Adiantum nelumboides]|nr:hypothetical protein [Adiantum nelumboides]
MMFDGAINMGYQSKEENGCVHRAGKIVIRKAGEAGQCLEKQASSDIGRGHTGRDNSRAGRSICVLSADEESEMQAAVMNGTSFLWPTVPSAWLSIGDNACQTVAATLVVMMSIPGHSIGAPGVLCVCSGARVLGGIRLQVCVWRVVGVLLGAAKAGFDTQISAAVGCIVDVGGALRQ